VDKVNVYKGFMNLIDGKKIYVEFYNNFFPNSILLIHGGPGESCISFSYVAFLLSSKINVFMMDQRGVMRSEEENRAEMLTIDQLIDDFEDVRKQLNLTKWNILGHSFGGYLALRYIIRYPDSIESAIYENPCFDIRNSLLQILDRYIYYYKGNGLIERECCMRELRTTSDIVKQLDGILAMPEIDRKRIFKSEAITNECRKFYDARLISDVAINRCLEHYDTIKHDSTLYCDYWDLLEKSSCQSLLLQGELDPMLPECDKNRWLGNANNEAVLIANTGHYIHSDAPSIFINSVIDYVGKEKL